jgi:hypothetical protein
MYSCTEEAELRGSDLAHARSAARGVSLGAISAADSWGGPTARLPLNVWAPGASSRPLTLKGCS